MRFKMGFLGASLAAVVALATACGSSEGNGSDSGGKTPEKFTFTAVLALSGPYAAIGEAQKAGMETAKSVINANGGVFGKPMEVEYIDSTSDPTQAVTKVQQRISEGKVQALGAGTFSSEIAAVVPVAQPHGLFVTHHGAGIGSEFFDLSKYPYVYCSAYQPSDQGKSLAAEFASKGYQRVGVLTTDNVAGEASWKALKTALDEKKIAGNVVMISDKATDATAQMQQVMATNPDVLLIDIYGAVAGPVLKARKDLQISVPTYGSQYTTSNNLAQLATPEQLDGITLQALSVGVAGSSVTTSKAFTTFYDALKVTLGGDPVFTMNQYVVAYNDVILAATAANLSNSDDPKKMSEAIDNLTDDQMPHWIGPRDFSSDRHLPTFGPEFWSFVPYGPTKAGLLQTN